MSVEMGIKNKNTGDYRVVPVSTAQGFREHWIPACNAIGLRMVQHFQDGTFTTVRIQEIPAIVSELKRLRAFVLDKPDAAWIADRVDRIVAAFDGTDPAQCEYDFG